MDSVKPVSSELMDTIWIVLNLFRTNGYHMDSVKLVSSELIDTIWIVLNLFLQN